MSAINVILRAFAAERRAVPPLLLSASRAAIDRSIDRCASRAHSSKRAAAECGGRMMG